MPAPSYGYIPAQDAALDAWATNFDTVITATPTAYGLIAGQATAFNVLRAAFTAALVLSTNPATRTVATVAAKDTKKGLMVVNARQLAMIAQGYPAITPLILTTAGLTVPNTVPTPVPAPVTVPVLTFLGSIGSVVTIAYADELTPSAKYKPFGSVNLQIVGNFGTAPPASPEIVPTLSLTGRWPVRINAGSGNNGKVAYLWARWVTRKGLVGPWSAMFSAIVQP